MADKQPEQASKKRLPEMLGIPGRVRMVRKWVTGGGPAMPVPPAGRIRVQHLRYWPGDEPRWPGQLIAGAICLVAGILIGRFLLP